VLVDLAERATPVTVTTTTGRALTGTIVLAATDVIVISGEHGSATYVRIDHIGSLRHGPGGRPLDTPAGGRAAPRPTTFGALLADLAPDRPRVALDVAGQSGLLTGELRAAGRDVLTIRLDGDPPGTVHVAVAQLSALVLLASG